jgi:hypothetical protein
MSRDTALGGGSERRGQSAVVGVALLLGLTMLSLGILTASVGTIVQSNAATADAGRVAADFESTLEPVEATGPGRGTVSFTDGTLRRVDRSVRVLNDSGVVATESVGALVYENAEHRVAFLSGGIVRGTGEGARFATEPPVVAGDDVLVVGVARLNASGPDAISGSETRVTLRTDVSHGRRTLGNDSYRVAVETATPAAWESYFRRADATTSRRDFDGDGVDSVVADFGESRTTYLVVHDLRVEVNGG